MSENKSLFHKPELDEMGTSGDHAKRVDTGKAERPTGRRDTAGAQTDNAAAPAETSEHRDAAGAQTKRGERSAVSDKKSGKSLFRKNDLDEMTVRRTEKPR